MRGIIFTLKQFKNGNLNAALFPDFTSTPDWQTYDHFDEQNIEKGGSHFIIKQTLIGKYNFIN